MEIKVEDGIEAITDFKMTNLELRCKKLDSVRKVCAIDGSVNVVKSGQVSDWTVSQPSIATAKSKAKRYEEYYMDLLKDRGAEEKLDKIKSLKGELGPLSEKLEGEREERKVAAGGAVGRRLADIEATVESLVEGQARIKKDIREIKGS